MVRNQWPGCAAAIFAAEPATWSTNILPKQAMPAWLATYFDVAHCAPMAASASRGVHITN